MIQKCYFSHPKMNFFTKTTIFESKKGACGNRPAGGKWFWAKRALAALGQPRDMFLSETKSACGNAETEGNVENVKIGLQRVAVRAFGTFPK